MRDITRRRRPEQSLQARSAEVHEANVKERLDKELKNTFKLLEARTGEQNADGRSY